MPTLRKRKQKYIPYDFQKEQKAKKSSGIRGLPDIIGLILQNHSTVINMHAPNNRTGNNAWQKIY